MVPVNFEGCAGYFHEAAGTRGVVICGSFGFEEICARKSVVLLAHELAARGVNVLRFDYFGTGDSLGGPLDADQVATWIGNIRAAADWLRSHGGVSDLSLVGLRLGALLAVNAADTIENLATLALIAPPVSGKAWLRESLAFSSMIAPPVGATTRGDSGDVLTGYRLSAETAADLKTLDWQKLATITDPSILIMAREQMQEAHRVAALATGHAHIEVLPFTGYGAMMCDPTASEPPMPTLRMLADQLAAGVEAQTSLPSLPPCLSLTGSGFVETPVQIGADAHINGVLCRPTGGEERRNIIVFFNAGGIPHTGWARMHVDIARKLACSGTSSLRIDLPGLGDSARPGDPSTIAIISQDLTGQIVAVNDWLSERGFVEIALAGSCSGAYHAFHAALNDARVDRLVLLNQVSFLWTATQALKLSAWQKSKAREMQTRASAIDTDEGQASEAAKLMARLFPNATKFARGSLEAMMTLSAMANSVLAKQNPVEAAFHAITGRGTRIMLVYSENDAGLAELDRQLGTDGLNALPGVSKYILANADHMLTQPEAREEFGDLIARFLDQRSTVRTNDMQATHAA
jgi:pimeloyl-ACP methyl ester carboxylesterase